MVHEALTSRACEEAFSYERVETMGDAVSPHARTLCTCCRTLKTGMIVNNVKW